MAVRVAARHALAACEANSSQSPTKITFVSITRDPARVYKLKLVFLVAPAAKVVYVALYRSKLGITEHPSPPVLPDLEPSLRKEN